MQQYNLQVINSETHTNIVQLAKFLEEDSSQHTEVVAYIFQNMPWCQKIKTSIDSEDPIARKYEELGPYLHEKEVQSKILKAYKDWLPAKL